MGVAFDGPDAAIVVDVDSGWRDDLRVLGEELDLEAGVE
jgi:hypothetical protein